MYHRLSINCLELAGGRSPGWPVTLASSQGYSCTGCASHFGEQPVLGALHGSANCPDSLRRNAAPTTSKGISVPVCFRSFPQERVEDVSICVLPHSAYTAVPEGSARPWVHCLLGEVHVRSDRRVTPPQPQSSALPSSHKPEGETLEGAAVGFDCGAGRTSWPSAGWPFAR